MGKATCIWTTDPDLKEAGHQLAKDLGKRSFSELVWDLVREKLEEREHGKGQAADLQQHDRGRGLCA